MPIYEYICRSCQHEFETLVRGGETPSCARCAGTVLDKKLSVFATQGESPSSTPAPCGTCGHAGGAGSCSIN